MTDFLQFLFSTLFNEDLCRSATINPALQKKCKSRSCWTLINKLKTLTITPFNILDALKNIKCCKSSGIDGISAEHFVIAHSRIHVLLSLLFSAFVMHGYLPSMFMKTTIVPIKKKTRLEIPAIKTITDLLL